ncbi:MAG: hypothetical protein QM831_10650 [Kofleriaceae bacterium]
MKSLALIVLAGCASAAPAVRLDEGWPKAAPDYDDTTSAWTRHTSLRGDMQEAMSVDAIFKSPDWRAAHASRDAEHRKLEGPARDAVLAQAQADMAGPYEVELLFVTWDRRENDLDRGKKSVWKVVLVDDTGKEIEPLEIVRDKRPAYVLHAEFPAYGDFATAYVARFPHDPPVLGSGVHAVRLRMSSERGGAEVAWSASAQ